MTEITPTEFEQEVAAQLRKIGANHDDLEVLHNQLMEADDGTYQIDVCVRFKGLGGVEYLTLVECKRHSSPIKRSVVAELHDKIQSLRAHKGIIYAKTSYQSGAVEYAKAHKIALITLIDGVESRVSSFTGEGDNTIIRKLIPDIPPFVGKWIRETGVVYLEESDMSPLYDFIFNEST